MWSDLNTHRCQKKLKQTTLLCFKQEIRSDIRLIIKQFSLYFMYTCTYACVCLYLHKRMHVHVCVCRLFYLGGGSLVHFLMVMWAQHFQHFSPVLWNSLILLFRLCTSYQFWISVSCFRLEIKIHYRCWLITFLNKNYPPPKIQKIVSI